MHEVANRVVSYDSEELILVDADDKEVGSMNKADCQGKSALPHLVRDSSRFPHGSIPAIASHHRSVTGDGGHFWKRFFSGERSSVFLLSSELF